MDDATIDSDSDGDDDQSLTEEEATAAAIIENDLKLSSLLERKNELPLRTRNKFNALVAELLTKTKDDIHEMICDKINIDDDDYRGLDSSRDTEAEVETAIRFFPEVISQTCGDEDDEEEEYPIQRLCISDGCCNVKSVSFIAVIAQVAIELHSFEDHERGGLLIEDGNADNTFRNLIYNFGSCPDQNDLLLTLLIRLRRMGLFKKGDIIDYRLVSICYCENDSAERGFQFLVEWDPTSLIQTHDNGWLPLHRAAAHNIRVFQIAFGYGICYYPFKKGINLLFQKNNDGTTPFQTACQKYGRDVVMEIVEEILTLYHSEGAPLHIIEALMVAAADENIHLDCSYFLLRREPDVLVRLLLSGPHSNNNNNNDIDDDDGGSDGGGNHNDGNDVDDNGDDNDNNTNGDTDGDGDIGKSKNNNRAGTRKRKRGGGV